MGTGYPVARSRGVGGGVGDVVGPASSVDGSLVLFDGATGKLLKSGGAPGVYLGAMSWATLQASAYANGSVGLAALPSDASVFITNWGIVMVPNAAKTFWTAPPFLLDSFGSGATGTDVMYAASGTSASATASSDSGTTTTVTHTGHGLTSTNNGVRLWVTGGTGWTIGGYPFTYIDANTYKLAVAYQANVPTIRVATGSSLQTVLRSVSIPAGLMQANSALESPTSWELTSSANTKNCTTLLGGSTIMSLLPASIGGYFESGRVTQNRGVKNAQITPQANLAIGGGTPRLLYVDTAPGTTFDYAADLRSPNEFMRLASSALIVRIGQ